LKSINQERLKGLTYHLPFDQNLKDFLTNKSISIIGITTFTEKRLDEKSQAVHFGISHMLLCQKVITLHQLN